MPRYFFNIEGDGHPDAKGIVLTGPKRARAEAVTLIGELLTEACGRFWRDAEWRLRVTDEAGATVCTLTIKGCLNVRQGDEDEPKAAAGRRECGLRVSETVPA